MNVYLILQFLFLKVVKNIDINYTSFTLDNYNLKNTIYGSGNRLKDVIYKSACIVRCLYNQNQTKIEIIQKNSFCCEWKTDVESLNCVEKEKCNYLENKLKNYLTFLILTVYFSLVLVLMIILFIVFFYLSSKSLSKKQSLRNGLVVVVLVLFTSTIIPIIVLKIISLKKKISITKLLGGEFKNISITKVIISVEIKNKERPENNQKFSELKYNYETNSAKMPSSDLYSVESGENNIDSKKLNLKDEDNDNKF